LARLAPTIIVLALLAATAASFAVSERLKLETVPVGNVHIRNKIFSPVCACPSDRVLVQFTLHRRDHVTVTILDFNHGHVRTLPTREVHRPGKLSFPWDGRDDDGTLVPDGAYRIRIDLRTHGRVINMPNLIHVDTVKPVVTAVTAPKPATISPDGDYHADSVVVGYHVSEHAHGILYLDGKILVFGRHQKLKDSFRWFGRRAGGIVPAGRHRLAVGAQDLAGNLAKPVPAGTITIRYLDVSPEVLRVAPGARVTLHLSTDARHFRWVLGRRHGFGRGRTLTLRGPVTPGRHVMYLEERGHAARVVLLVK
jgi:hypothetical protein